MRLTDLEPQFHRYETRPDPPGAPGFGGECMHHVDSLAEAQGIIFLCPGCFAKNGGAVGTHAIEVSFAGRGVQDHQGSHNRQGQPSRWNVSGAGYADLTLAPSVDVDCWHGFVTNGEIR